MARRFHGGVHPPEGKERTEKVEGGLAGATPESR